MQRPLMISTGTALMLFGAVANAGMVDVEVVYGNAMGEFFAARWSGDSGAGCELSQGTPGQEQVWKKAPDSACADIQEFVGDQKGALADELIEGAPMTKDRNGNTVSDVPLQYGSRTARVRVDSKLTLVANLAPTGSCDMDNPNDCEKPKLSAATRLALLVRKATTKTLGEMPHIPSRD